MTFTDFVELIVQARFLASSGTSGRILAGKLVCWCDSLSALTALFLSPELEADSPSILAVHLPAGRVYVSDASWVALPDFRI